MEKIQAKEKSQVETNINLVAVNMLTFNQKEKTVRCLSSFRSITYPHLKIILWDNGSDDGTSDYVKLHFPGVLVHHHDSNIGAEAGRNGAAELAINNFNPSYLLFIDNDTVVTSGFLEPLLEPFDRDEKLGQTSAKIRFLNDMNRINDAGGSKIEYWKGSTMPIGFGEIDNGQYDKPTKCIAPTTCMLVRTEVFKEVGGFDPVFGPWGYGDLDFSLRVRDQGYYGLYVPKAVVFHDPSRTSFEDGVYTEKYAKHKTRTWFLFMRRHATLLEQLSFVVIGVPFILFRVVLRGVRKGNFAFFKGLFSGFLEFCRSRFNKGH